MWYLLQKFMSEKKFLKIHVWFTILFQETSWSGNHPGMLSGTKWTDFVLTWNDGFISLYIKDKSTPIFVHEYGHKIESLLFQNYRYFDYFSVKGSSALWSFTFCNSGK